MKQNKSRALLASQHTQAWPNIGIPKPTKYWPRGEGEILCWTLVVGIVKNRRFGDERQVSESKKVLQMQRDANDLDETAKTEVLLDDNVIDSCHNEADLCGIGSASKVGIDLLCLMLI